MQGHGGDPNRTERDGPAAVAGARVRTARARRTAVLPRHRPAPAGLRAVQPARQPALSGPRVEGNPDHPARQRKARDARGQPVPFPEEILESYKLPAHPSLPFAGGAVGYLGYDLCHFIERLPATAADDLRVPDMAMAFYDTALVMDHQRQRAWIAAADLGAPGRPDAEHRAAEMFERLSCAARPTPPHPGPAIQLGRAKLRSGDRVQFHAGRLSSRDQAREGLHRRGRHLPGEPLTPVRGADLGLRAGTVSAAAPDQSRSDGGVPGRRRFRRRQRLARAVPARAPGPRGDAPDQGHAPARPHAGGGRGARAGTAPQREGRRRAGHDRGPRAQRPGPRLLLRHRPRDPAEGAGVLSHRPPSGRHGRRPAPRRLRSDGTAEGGLPRRLDHRRAENPRDADH